jgi:hypothetical protein
LFDPLIRALGKAISLGVEGRRQVLLDSQFRREGSAEVGGEAGISVGDDFLG